MQMKQLHDENFGFLKWTGIMKTVPFWFKGTCIIPNRNVVLSKACSGYKSTLDIVDCNSISQLNRNFSNSAMSQNQSVKQLYVIVE